MLIFSKMWTLSVLLGLFIGSTTAAALIANIPGLASPSASVVQFLSAVDGLDGPKIEPVNSSVFDWWYFDAVSDEDQSSIVVTFFTSSNDGFLFLYPSPIVTPVYIWTSNATGAVNSWVFDAQDAIVRTLDNGASGSWTGSGVSWEGSADMSTYTITIDADEEGISGTFTLQSRGPAHYPCNPVGAGHDMQIAPHIGWANAIPDAHATIDLVVNGGALVFTGTGYHDKNWSDEPFSDNVQTWVWGHGTVGPYSVVWFDYLDWEGTEFVSGYVVRDGAVVASSCDVDAVKVRPVGDGTTWPPTNAPESFRVDLDMGNDGVLGIDVVPGLVIGGLAGSPYTRWIGTMSGSLSGSSEVLSGVAVLDQIVL